jgi:hypothetical protein
LVASRRLRFNPLAEAELQDAASWYDERVAGLGGRFITAIRHRASEIMESPHRWPLIHGARRVLVGFYPYAIIYRERSPTRRSRSWRSLISNVGQATGRNADRADLVECDDVKAKIAKRLGER